MAASTPSRLCRVGSSLLGAVSNNLSGLTRTSINSSLPLTSFQQIRTFIQMGTKLKVVDNSGAKKVKSIAPLKGKKGARLGDMIVASVKEAQAGGKVKKGNVVYGVVVRAAMQRGRCDGFEVKFDDNAVVGFSVQFHTSLGRKNMSRFSVLPSILLEHVCFFSPFLHCQSRILLCVWTLDAKIFGQE